ncbi:hypothetical protein MMC18_002707 [Xylographa bjoerkii]|nr:hypothetical protein [Xylographa bjoerkii]
MPNSVAGSPSLANRFDNPRLRNIRKSATHSRKRSWPHDDEERMRAAARDRKRGFIPGNGSQQFPQIVSQSPQYMHLPPDSQQTSVWPPQPNAQFNVRLDQASTNVMAQIHNASASAQGSGPYQPQHLQPSYAYPVSDQQELTTTTIQPGNYSVPTSDINFDTFGQFVDMDCYPASGPIHSHHNPDNSIDYGSATQRSIPPLNATFNQTLSSHQLHMTQQPPQGIFPSSPSFASTFTWDMGTLLEAEEKCKCGPNCTCEGCGTHFDNAPTRNLIGDLNSILVEDHAVGQWEHQSLDNNQIWTSSTDICPRLTTTVEASPGNLPSPADSISADTVLGEGVDESELSEFAGGIQSEEHSQLPPSYMTVGYSLDITTVTTQETTDLGAKYFEGGGDLFLETFAMDLPVGEFVDPLGVIIDLSVEEDDPGRPAATNTLQQRVTALDRSTERFSIQIAEAYSLLNIEADSVTSTYSQAGSEEEARIGFTPKEQWVMRWLLKRFEGDTVQLGSPCLEPRAWILLRIVVARLPLTVTARLLSAHKFMTTVQKTLDWLSPYVLNHPQSILMPEDEHSPKVPLSRESSSSTTVQEMPSVASKKSKKRKRSQPKAEILTDENEPGLDSVMLYVAICGALSQIEAFTNDKPGEAENFAIEHMKAAIKTSIEQSAKILGDSLAMLVQIISVPNNFCEAANYDIFLRPTVGVWSLRSIFQETNDGLVSAQAFSTYCSLPALRLLLRIQAIPYHDDGITSIALAAQKLIATHVILPARTAFMRVKGSNSDENQISTVIELLGPLSRAVFPKTQDASHSTSKSSIMNTIPMFFEYAIKLLPRDMPKQRMTEAPWLQALFIQLAGCLSLSFPLSKISTPNESVLDTLECLLRLLVENNVPLGVPILESIVLYISGIYPLEAQRRARWSLVGLCMEISPDLAIPVRSNGNVRAGQPTLQPDVVLNRILDKLTDSGFRNGNETTSDYDIMLNNVVLRLLKSFLNARDLLGFLNIWKQQIRLWEIARVSNADSGKCSVLAASIWEDEALLQAVAEQLEQALTAAHISKLLADLGSGIANDSDTLAIETIEPYAQVVVLDCALDGVRSDSVISICKISIETIGPKLGAVLRSNTALLIQQRWRLWRTLATMASRFLYYQDDLICHARDRIALGLAEESNSPNLPASPYEALFALRFLISAEEARQTTNQSGEHSEALNAVARAVINSVPSVPPPDGRTGANQCSQWDGQRETVTSGWPLLLASTAQLASVPKVLSKIESSILYLFLRMVYRRAAYSAYISNSPRNIPSENTSITFIGVWQELVEIGMAGESPPIAGAICHIVYNVFLETHSVGRNGIQAEEAEYAIYAISRMSLGAFERYEREHIIRRVSDELLNGTSLPNYSQYISLLVRSLDYPKKSMYLLSDPAYLWNLANQLERNSEAPAYSSGLVLFRQLATKSINIAISDCLESQNTSFFDAFLDNFATRSRASGPEPAALAKSILKAVSLKLLWRHYNDLPKMLKSSSPSLIDMCQELFEWLPQCLAQWRAGQENWVLSVVLDILETCLAMLESGLSNTVTDIRQSNALSQINQLSEWTKALTLQKSPPSTLEEMNIYSVEDLVVVAKKIEASISPDGQVTTAMVNIAAIEEFTTLRARRAWIQYLADSLWKLDEQKQANLVTQLINMDYTNDSTLHYVVRILNHTYEKTPNMKSALAQLFSKICMDLHQMSSTRSCILEMHCLDLAMKKNPWTISQWHIDSLLSTITILTAPSHTPSHAISSDIFTCLCRLFGTVLALHRSKLGGRYHLVVPALQGLLRCFFTPYSSQPLNLPILNPTHASAYARLLTSLCDPSVSAVKRSKNRQRAELNDETKKARNIAGQHLQYLIMEFCVCQLKGRMQPEVRAALNPGLYAIFDAMGQEVMRTVNAALDVGGRAIFKVVYEDHRRFGRWNGG